MIRTEVDKAIMNLLLFLLFVFMLPEWEENAWRLLSSDDNHIRHMDEFDYCIVLIIEIMFIINEIS